MDELHGAIAAHLRSQRPQLAERGERELEILNIWQDRCAVPCCTICGVAIDDVEGGLCTLANMRQVREYRDYYIPF